MLHAFLVDELKTTAGHVSLALLRIRDTLVLDRTHRKHLRNKSVKLIEAAPRAGSGQALEDIAHGAVVHLR